MCLGIPMKVVRIKGEFADVSSGRLMRCINIQLLADLKVGEYVMVHAGFAIERVDPQEARKTLRIIDEIR
jgi:hydrogenase expression/formation protein HypC